MGLWMSAQVTSFKKTGSMTGFKVNKMKIDFQERAEQVKFSAKLAKGNSGLESLPIHNDFKFIYTLADPIHPLGLEKMKVEITDQPNTQALIKEVDNSIKAILELKETN